MRQHIFTHNFFQTFGNVHTPYRIDPTLKPWEFRIQRWKDVAAKGIACFVPCRLLHLLEKESWIGLVIQTVGNYNRRWLSGRLFMRYLCIRSKVRAGRTRPDGRCARTREDTCYYTSFTYKEERQAGGKKEEDEDRVPEGTRHEPRLLGFSGSPSFF